MFMTLKCSGNEAVNEMQHLHSTDRLGRPDNMSHMACNSCRKKKLRCSRDKAGCRRCQQRGIRCVYDDGQRVRSSNSKSQEGTTSEGNRPATSRDRNSAGQQGDASAQGNGRPSCDADGSSTIQVAIPSGSSQHTQDHQMPSDSDAGPGSSGSSHSDREATHQQRPRDQQNHSHENASHVVATGTDNQLVAPDVTDPGLFFDFTEEYLSNPHESLVKLLDPFGTDGGIISHGHMPVPIQMSDINSRKRSPGGSSRPFFYNSNKQQSLTPPDQAMRTSSTKSSSNTYSNSNSSGPTSASSSTSLRNCMDVDTDSYDDGDCECTETALQILEQVVTPSVGGGWAMAENNILLLKNNISRCLVLSKCRECRQESGICMLTLVIYEKLTASFEGVAQWWGRQRVEAQGSAKGRRERQQQKQQTQIAMGRYQIDTAEEHRAVFATIIAWQLQRLSGLAILMVEHSKQTKWRAHVEYSEAIRRRITILEETWKC